MGLKRLPLPPRNGGEIDGLVLDALTKGIPDAAGRVRLGEVGAKGWNIFRGDIPLPAAVMRADILARNNAWMAAFLDANGLLIAPHGKTTMAPQLYAMQHGAGAWAITVATTQQMAVARHFGFPRVIIANQPTGRAAIDACFAALADPAFELHVLADSLACVSALADGARRAGSRRPLGVLVEMGVPGGRTGTRTREEALAVARAVVAAPGLALTGIECFEGILPDTRAVDAMLDDVLAVAAAAVSEGLFPPRMPVVLSAGGSAFYDRVGERFGPALFGDRPVLKVIRSGCYLTHDAIGYETSHDRILRETSLHLPPGRLTAALEVWTSVQSRPEPGKAILTAGKRDVSHDSHLPIPTAWFRPGGGMDAPQPLPPGHVVSGLNDQHAHLTLPADSPLAVGDMVSLGIAHPCTTFDKWDVLLVVDAEGTVVDAVKTYF
ncbi:type III PLP-dependent enzyme domain-containing protein [Alsobacter sp. R-9]